MTAFSYARSFLRQIFLNGLGRPQRQRCDGQSWIPRGYGGEHAAAYQEQVGMVPGTLFGVHHRIALGGSHAIGPNDVPGAKILDPLWLIPLMKSTVVV